MPAIHAAATSPATTLRPAAAPAVLASPAWIAFVWSSLPGLALAAAAASGVVPEGLALGLFAISFVGLNLMHMGATWSRVYVRPGWRVNPTERLAVPMALAAFALAYEAVGGGAVLLAVQYFLSFHHALMQNYGLVRASQRRSERRIDPRLDLAACLLLPGAALLYRAGMVSDQYAGAVLPSVPLPLVELLAVAGAVALAAFGWREWRAHRRGERVDPIGAGIFFGTNLMWSGLLVADPHPAMPLYALASGHYAQYLYFVRQVETRDQPLAAAQPVGARVESSLRRSWVAYLVALLALAGVVTVALTGVSAALRAGAEWLHLRPTEALAIPAWAAAMIGINLQHYWLDHRIWRTRAPRGGATATAPQPG